MATMILLRLIPNPYRTKNIFHFNVYLSNTAQLMQLFCVKKGKCVEWRNFCFYTWNRCTYFLTTASTFQYHSVQGFCLPISVHVPLCTIHLNNQIIQSDLKVYCFPETGTWTSHKQDKLILRCDSILHHPQIIAAQNL